MVESHRIARSAFVSALAFAVIAAGWSVYILAFGGSWWGPLHSFLAGTVLLAISGASQMFTITWSTVPPSRMRVASQRWLLIAGVGAVLVGITFGVPSLVWVGGAGAAASMVLLGSMSYASVRRSLLRRFDLSARFYLAAFAAGAVGITLGTMMGAGMVSGSLPNIRLVHSHLNLVGLVGLTIIGTIPTLLPTTAYSRSVSGREAVIAWWVRWSAQRRSQSDFGSQNSLVPAPSPSKAAGGLILGGILRRLWDRGRHKLTFLQITIGTIWLIGWSVVDGAQVVFGGTTTHFSGWTGAVVLAGVGQVLAGSLAYLVPVLKGPPFEANRRFMEERIWLPLIALNVAALTLGAGLSAALVILSSAWVVDFGIRLARVSRRRTDIDVGGTTDN